MTRIVRVAVATVALLATALLGACGGDSSTVEWRDLTLTLPDGWVDIQQLDDVLYVGNGEPGTDGDPGDLTVGVQFQTVATPSASGWRDLVDDRGGVIELDIDDDLSGVPASVVQFTLPGAPDATPPSPPTRERVLVLAARDLEILAQAVPVANQMDGPQVFLDHVDDIDALLDSIVFGAPL